MRRAAALVAVALLAACGSSGKPLHASAEHERRWVASLQDWLAVESFQGNFRGCAERLHQRVGDSPARDLEPVDSAVSRLCDAFEQAYSDLDRAFKTNDSTIYQRSQREMHRAEAQLAPVRALVDAWRPGAGGGLPTRGGLVESSRIEPRFSDAASAIAHTRVSVRCWSQADWPRIERVARAEGAAVTDLAGLADPTTETADLSPEVCHDLVGLAYLGERTSARAAFGLTVLAHEATHLREDAGGSEAVTECYAMQRDVEAAPKLGLTHAEAQTLAQVYWTDIYPEDTPEYFTADCRDGGPYDLHPHDTHWP